MLKKSIILIAFLLSVSANAQVVGGGPVIPGSPPVDLSPYVLLAGDADGQTVQGRTGANAARVDIGETVPDEAKLVGGGATSGFIKAYADGVYGESPDGNTSFDLYNAGLDLQTAGDLTVWGATSSIFGIASGPTTIQGAKISFSSQQTAPTNANDTCETGDTIDTASFHYFCYTTNTWVRVAMATW